MAVLAYIFHWRPADMHPMPVAELMDWHRRAVDLHNQAHGAKG